MMRLTSPLVAFSLLTSAATAYAECSWRVQWPTDDRIWAVPWGTVPRGSFVTRTACEKAIENMLQEAIRDQTLLIEVPACVCVSGRDDLARSHLLEGIGMVISVSGLGLTHRSVAPGANRQSRSAAVGTVDSLGARDCWHRSTWR